VWFCRRSSLWRLLGALLVAASGQIGMAQEAIDDPVVGVIKQNAVDERSFDGVKITANKMSIDLIERFSKDLEFRERLLRVDGHDPEIISVAPLGASGLRIRGLQQGVTTMVCTGETGQKYVIEVYVGGDARLLQSVLKQNFPDSAIQCRALLGGNILLTGYVTDNQTITQIMEVARLYAPEVINHMRVGGPQEVQLRCKIMEVQRSKLRTFGVNLQAMTKSAVIASAPGSITPITSLINPIGGPPSAAMAPSTANPLSLAAGFSNNQFAFDLFVQALKEEGLLKVMSEPILVARSGEAARLSDGGEFPIPVPGGLGTVTIEFREFGVILEMLPIVISPTRVKQQVTAEVSDKDTANAITLLGTTVPGLTKRRVQSTVDMNFGDTMVVAGMINTRVAATFQKTPLIGEFPGVGAFFSKKVYQQTETELVILITPEFGSSLAPDQVPFGGPGMSTTAPTDRELYLHGLMEVPKYGPDCGPDCQMTPSMQYGGSTYSGSGMNASGPLITPTPSPACSPNSNGLISPPGTDSPGVTVPPPNADPGVSRKSSAGLKEGFATSSKSKNPSKAASSSPIIPAGFNRFSKAEKSSQNRSSDKKNKMEE
jgi:pilus assembly protein CpaC